MKFATVCGCFCGLLSAAQETPAAPELNANLVMVIHPDDIPAACPKDSGPVTMEDLQACYDSTRDYKGIYTYMGQVSAGAWSGSPCATETADNSAAYLSVESLISYLPAWMKQFGTGMSGTYTLTLQAATTTACSVSLLLPTDPTAECVAPIEGDKVGEVVAVPSGATSFTIPTEDLGNSTKVAVVSEDCTLAELGTALLSIDATDAKYSFLFLGGSSDTTSKPGQQPEGVSARVFIGGLLGLTLAAVSL